MHDETSETSEPVSVEIYDQIYTLRGTDQEYIEMLAGVVDAKMRAVAEQGNTVDSLRVAVLAALNIADELQCLRDQYAQIAGSLNQTQRTMRSRSESLNGMLDEVLDEFEHGAARRAG